MCEEHEPLRRRLVYDRCMDELQRQGAIRELYGRLRAIARSRMDGQAGSHTLDPTCLANEAVLRLLKCDAAAIKNEEHLLALAAEAMRQILIDHARAKAAKKRGGSMERSELTDVAGGMLCADPDQILAANDALAVLESEDEETATLVKLRLFAGLAPEEVAALLGISRRTVERRWRYAIASLKLGYLGGARKGTSCEEQASEPG